MWRIAVKRTIGGEVEEQDEDLGVLNPTVHQAFWALPKYSPFFLARSLPDSSHKKSKLEREKKCMGHTRAWFPTAASGKKPQILLESSRYITLKPFLVP